MKKPRIEDWMFQHLGAGDTKGRAKVRKIARRLQTRGNRLKGGAARRWKWLIAELC